MKHQKFNRTLFFSIGYSIAAVALILFVCVLFGLLPTRTLNYVSVVLWASWLISDIVWKKYHGGES